MVRILFLPGAGGRADFWRPAGELLPADWERDYLSWPGLGVQPQEPDVKDLDDLVGLVLARLDRPADLVAQSMGTLVALKAALAMPDKVRRLVLAGPASGVPVFELGGANWHADYRHEFPDSSHWITTAHEDLSSRLSGIAAPTLLMIGTRDPISPLAIAQRFAELLVDARIEVIEGGQHDFPETRPVETAKMIRAHLA